METPRLIEHQNWTQSGHRTHGQLHSTLPVCTKTEDRMVELWIIILRPEEEWVDLHRLGVVHFLPVRVGLSHAGIAVI